jgi:hypothetical protein
MLSPPQSLIHLVRCPAQPLAAPTRHAVDLAKVDAPRRRINSQLCRFNLHPLAAFSKAAMSILSISIIAFMTRFAFPASGSANISPRKTGLICHERPNLSLSQPHRPVDPPWLISVSLGVAPSRLRIGQTFAPPHAANGYPRYASRNW